MTNDDDDAGIDIFNDDHGHYPCCVIVFSRQWRQPQILSSCEAGIARRKKSNRRAYRDQGAAKGRMSGDKTGGWVGGGWWRRLARRGAGEHGGRSGRKNSRKQGEERGTNRSNPRTAPGKCDSHQNKLGSPSQTPFTAKPI